MSRSAKERVPRAAPRMVGARVVGGSPVTARPARHQIGSVIASSKRVPAWTEPAHVRHVAQVVDARVVVGDDHDVRRAAYAGTLLAPGQGSVAHGHRASRQDRLADRTAARGGVGSSAWQDRAPTGADRDGQRGRRVRRTGVHRVLLAGRSGRVRGDAGVDRRAPAGRSAATHRNAVNFREPSAGRARRPGAASIGSTTVMRTFSWRCAIWPRLPASSTASPVEATACGRRPLPSRAPWWRTPARHGTG